jgi:hypothetical protein
MTRQGRQARKKNPTNLVENLKDIMKTSVKVITDYFLS